jgi:hypothetical protein
MNKICIVLMIIGTLGSVTLFVYAIMNLIKTIKTEKVGSNVDPTRLPHSL